MIRHFSQITDKIQIEKVIDLLIKNSDILLLKGDINKSFTDILKVLDCLKFDHIDGEESLLNSNSEYNYYRELLEKVEKQLDSKKH